MMRRLGILLLAALVAVGLNVPGAYNSAFPSLFHAKPAHASASCWFSDFFDTWYDDWYITSSEVVQDLEHGGQDVWHVDLKGFRNSRGSDNHCLRYYYASIWDTNGWAQQVQVTTRVWVCGAYQGAWVASNLNPNPANRVQVTTGIYDYGQGPCYPQADDYISFAHSSQTVDGLIPRPDNSVQGNCVYVDFDGPNGANRLPNCAA